MPRPPRLPRTPGPTARPWIVALVGLLAAGLAIGVGAVAERARFGATTADAQAAVEQEVRDTITRRAAMLEALATRLARHPDITAALERPRERTEAPFAAIERTAGPNAPAGLGVLVHSAEGGVVAWRGRPAPVPAARLSAPAAVFVAPGPTGMRLVRVEPVTQAGTGRRLGAVAAELVITSSPGVSGLEDVATLPTRLVPVHVLTRPPAPAATVATFDVPAANGDVLFTAVIDFEDVARARERVGAHARGIAVLCLALALAAIAAGSSAQRGHRGVLWALASLFAARVVLWAGLPSTWRDDGWLSASAPSPFHASVLLRSPLDLLLTALLLLGLAAGAFDLVERWRLKRRARRRAPAGVRAWSAFFLLQVMAAAVATSLVAVFEDVLRQAVLARAFTGLDISFLPWDLSRSTLFTGLVLLHVAVVWAAVVVLRGALGASRAFGFGPAHRALVLAAWLASGLLVATAARQAIDLPVALVLLVLALAGLAALRLERGLAWFRRGSQGLRLAALSAAVIVPTLALQPSLAYVTERARESAVASRFVPQVMRHPEELQYLLTETLRQIDAMPELARLVATLPEAPDGTATEAAFSVWQQTALAERRLTSAIELYGRTGRLVSRFALNFPEYGGLTQHWHNESCGWGEVFGEAAPFGAEERRMLHAERAVCDASGRPRGSIVVHVMLDYGALPFLSTQTPYFEVFRTPQAAAPIEAMPGADVALAVYGWGRTPIYTSTGRAWPIAADLFERVYATREPFWTRIGQGERTDNVYFANDRYGIYAVGYPEPSWFHRLVRLAELATFGALTFAALYLLSSFVRSLVRPRSGPALQLAREVRTSFSRKLFLAFVAAAVVPVLVLAFSIRVYVASRLRAEVEAEAARTAAVAQRVILETLATQRRDEVSPTALSDDVMVWISRVIDQDVNIFAGTQVVATSERDLFASGLLPTRVPDDVYRAILLQRLPSYVTVDQIADLRYLMAAAPIRTGDEDAILTVPLALQQREIQRETQDLDRGVLLGVVLVVLFGSGVGYALAHRIADPVARLTRASRRIAAGELSARVFVRTADELQRLVESFNSMAHELERQRAQLEHTNRLEAWAEMARQVAHDIKNPLTPIQLSAEHLQRVHRDRGEPLSPVLDYCLDTILSQVRLLRRISSEFSSFASTPSVSPEPTDIGAMLAEIVGHYRVGLEGRVAIQADIADGLPPLSVDRLLISRAVTNVIENALQAMPSGGELHVSAALEDNALAVRVRDTGVGMGAEEAQRAFDPSFSTKATGTGLGLPIARRNVELHGGEVSVASAEGAGTTVTFRLPLQ